MGFMSNPASGGDFDPYLKFNAKAGRYYTKNDEGEEYEVTNMTAVFDFDNLKTGWFTFEAGQAPEKVFDPSLSEAADKPHDKAKRGFEIKVFSEKNLGGKCEFASTAGAVIDAMNELYDEWQAGLSKNKGKVPVIKSDGVEAINGKHGTNYKPVLKIVSWTDRPEELDGDGGSGQVQEDNAPPPEKAKEPAMADDDVEF